jgi:CMP-N,N'-diacetyllegionaminic acid synthase
MASTPMRVLGLITARGGSKGIPGKNIKPLLGKPLIAYTIDAAKDAGVFDRVILSTDDEEIAAVARAHGSDVPFMRPAALADDKAAHLPVVQHALAWLKENEGYTPDAVMLLQPTSPARQAFHIREAVELLAAHPDADSVLSVAPVPDSYNSAKTMRKEDEYLRLINGQPIYRRIARRQDLTGEYWSTGLVYLFRTNLLSDPTNPNFYGEKTLPYEIDEKYRVDINEPADWPKAETALTQLATEGIVKI